jgi:predicted Zn-dependent peptidase
MPQVETVSLSLWQRVGSVHESSGTNGMTHFIEHMLFKGTSRHSARDIAMRMDSVGAAMNAFTSREKTCFYANVMAAHAPMVFDLLRDMYYDSIFPAREIAREKQVVMQEIHMYEDSPDDSVHDAFITQLWPTHSLGYSVSGKAENIAAIRRDSLMRFFKKHYVTDRLVISLAGAINPEEIKDMLSRWPERRIANGASEACKGQVPQPEYTLFSHRKPLEQVHLLLAMPGISKTHPWRFAISLLNQIWGGSMSSRLFQRIREETGVCYSIYTFPAMMHEIGFFGIYCATSDKYLDKVLSLIRRENDLLLRRGISGEELRYAKEQLKSAFLIGRECVESRMNYNAMQELVFGRPGSVRGVLAGIEKVEVDEVNEAIRFILGEAKYAARTLGPKDTMPVLERHFSGTPHAQK